MVYLNNTYPRISIVWCTRYYSSCCLDKLYKHKTEKQMVYFKVLQVRSVAGSSWGRKECSEAIVLQVAMSEIPDIM